MARQEGTFADLIHSPSDLAKSYVSNAEFIRSTPGVQFGVTALDKVIIPMRPGNLTCIIARPGMGKTSLLAYMARAEARRIQERGAQQAEAVVYVTWEQSAEELEAFFQTDSKVSSSDIAWGRADMEMVKHKAAHRPSLPIWIIGHGIGRSGRKVPRMTLDAVLSALETMQDDYGVKPTLMLFDYMQLIPVARARDRVSQVTEAPILVKELALRVGSPAVCGVQARREVDDTNEKIPDMRDAQWASSIEQTGDKVLSMMRPIRYWPAGGTYELRWTTPYREVPINESLCIVRLLKQRFDKGRYTWAMHFEPELLKLEEKDLNAPDPGLPQVRQVVAALAGGGVLALTEGER